MFDFPQYIFDHLKSGDIYFFKTLGEEKLKLIVQSSIEENPLLISGIEAKGNAGIDLVPYFKAMSDIYVFGLKEIQRKKEYLTLEGFNEDEFVMEVVKRFKTYKKKHIEAELRVFFRKTKQLFLNMDE